MTSDALCTLDGARAAHGSPAPIGPSRTPWLKREFSRRLPILVGAGSLLVGALAWQLYGALQKNNLFIPTFTQMVEALVGQVFTADFWDAYGKTLIPFTIGWVAAMAIGITFGVAMGMSALFSKLATPYLSFLNALPISALVPLVVIAAGIDITAGAILVFLFAIVDVTLTSSAGVRYVDEDLKAMARTFGMGSAAVFRKVIWPGSMPGILAAIRVGTGRAIVGMVVMELLLVSTGVGKLITRYKDRFESAELYAVVVSLAVFGLIMLGLTRNLERRVLRWQPSRKREQ